MTAAASAATLEWKNSQRVRVQAMYSALLAAEVRTLTGTHAPPARAAAKMHTTAVGSFGAYTATESPEAKSRA